MGIRLIPAFVVAIILCDTLEARPIGVWSYKALAEQADLVLIGTVESIRAVDEKLDQSPFGDILEGRLTTFKVETVLKGNASDAKIELVHFQVQATKNVPNGPLLATFVSKEHRLTITSVDGVEVKQERLERKPEYLLFLKVRPDGRYEPVSGQVDSSFSARKVLSAE